MASANPYKSLTHSSGDTVVVSPVVVGGPAVVVVVGPGGPAVVVVVGPFVVVVGSIVVVVGPPPPPVQTSTSLTVKPTKSGSDAKFITKSIFNSVPAD